ncbi:MAG: hypothetical protein JW913_19650 [Chitinispirillaceae bacterium]|nr:hypothetical protein [Chitinispirillaceae bacterium]
MKISSTWKSFERRAAELFGGIRNAFSGATPGLTGSRADVRHPHLFIEAKYRQRHSLASLWRDTAVKAAAERKIPIIVLKEHNQRGCLIAFHSDDLERLAKAGDYSDLPLFASSGKPINKGDRP